MRYLHNSGGCMRQSRHRGKVLHGSSLLFPEAFPRFGLRLFHARALDLPWQATDQQNVRSNTKADHNELMKVQRGVKKKAVVGRKEKTRSIGMQ